MFLALPNRVSDGNIFYFIPPVLLFFSIVGVVLLSKRFGKKFAYPFATVLVWANFALHFLKIFMPYYQTDYPNSLWHIGVPNVCAVYIVFAPFLFHFGNKYLKDYLFYLGVVPGIGAFLIFVSPTTLLGARGSFDNPMYLIETTRYYTCHALMVLSAIAMCSGKIHELNYHRLWAIPLWFAVALGLTFAQGVLLGPILKHPWFPHEWWGPDSIFNRFGATGCMNQSFALGPDAGKDAYFTWLYPYLIPYLMKYEAWGHTQFVPVIWSIPLMYIVTAIFGIPVSAPYDHARIKKDFGALGHAFGRLFHRKKA